MVPLFKKGDRNNKDNYRGICLLSMGSRVLARVIARRLRWWSEHCSLVDENQCGFRPGRSTADATQVLVRIQEDVTDLRRRQARERERGNDDGNDENDVNNNEVYPVARLLDLRKAYPRVNKPMLWRILDRYGLSGAFKETITALHETTAYKVKGKGKDSNEWYPERGLREGCPTSPTLFNIYHQAVMRQAEVSRERLAADNNRTAGVEWRWVPGNCFPGQGLWEKYNSEAKTVRITSSLFLDDTTIIGMKNELEDGVREIKRVMNKFEEKNNEDKEETLAFGTPDSEEIRMLGSWMGPEADIRNRIRRAGGIWGRVKRQLKGTRLSKKMQARIFESCVEGALLFDCQTRTWYKKDWKKLQSWVDKCYRYIWSNKTCPPLIQMQREHVNMQDVRNSLEITSIQCKIERRTLERIGHVMRMPNSRLTKVAALGWLKELEAWDKCPGRKRKTVLYWKWTLKQAGVDWCDIERLTADREDWRKRIRERCDHIKMWEKQRAHAMDDIPEQERVQRSQPCEDEDPWRCKWPGGNKVCKSKGGLSIHRKRIQGATRDEEDLSAQSVGCASKQKTPWSTTSKAAEEQERRA